MNVRKTWSRYLRRDTELSGESELCRASDQLGLRTHAELGVDAHEWLSTVRLLMKSWSAMA